MVRAPKTLNLDDYADQFETASSWVPFDLLEAMRLKGYTVNIKNQYNRRGLLAQGKKGKGFRAFTKNKHAYMARNDRGDEFAHEFGHQVDAFFSGNKIDRGAWTNKAFVGKDRDGYRKFFNKLRGSSKGTYTNGDGQFWRDNWLRDYEGRIYPNSPDGLEFWAMNCQRYSLHRAGKTVKGIATWDQVKRRYPDMAKYIEDLFERDFIKG